MTCLRRRQRGELRPHGRGETDPAAISAVLFNSRNQSPRPDATSIPATFLRATVAV